MKNLHQHSFDPSTCRKDLNDFSKLLSSNKALKEATHILPFFKKRHDISMLISRYIPNIKIPDVIAHEFPIYGHFKADLITGDSISHEYLLVEFEDGTPNGIFKKVASKSTLEWSPRFEHGFSQILDWLWKLEDMRSTGDFTHVFGSRDAKFHGLIVIGKGVNHKSQEKSRLSWRMDRVVVDSHKLSCVTFEGLYEDLDFWLSKYYGK